MTTTAPKMFRATVVTVLVMILIVATHHRNDKTLICKEKTVNGQVYANNCVAK